MINAKILCQINDKASGDAGAVTSPATLGRQVRKAAAEGGYPKKINVILTLAWSNLDKPLGTHSVMEVYYQPYSKKKQYLQ